jgi:hypothetical protein
VANSRSLGTLEPAGQPWEQDSREVSANALDMPAVELGDRRLDSEVPQRIREGQGLRAQRIPGPHVQAEVQ